MIPTRAVFVAAAIGLCSLLSTHPVAAQLFTGGFEASQGYVPGDIQGQNGWSYYGNTFTDGVVTNSPAGTPASLGSQSLLLRTTIAQNNGVTSGVLAPVTPHGIPGSRVGGIGGSGLFAADNVYQGDFWFRTAADTVGASGISDGAFFFQANLASKDERFGRVMLFERTATGFNVLTDPYLSYDTDLSDGDQSDAPDQYIATNLQFGQWYHIHTSTTFNAVTQAGGLYTNHDVLTAEVFDSNGASLGSVNNGSTWMSAWVATPGGFNDANAGHYAIDRLNFLSRGGGIPNGTPIMYIDAVSVPEPASLALLVIGAACLVVAARRKHLLATSHIAVV